MNNLSTRALLIIDILKGLKHPVSSLALSEEIGCSTKTIQSEIKDINKQLKDTKIISIRGVGYKLEGKIDVTECNNNHIGNIDRKYNKKKIIDATFTIVNPKGDKHINKGYYQRVPVYTVEEIVNKNLPIIYKDAKVKKDELYIMKIMDDMKWSYFWNSRNLGTTIYGRFFCKLLFRTL